MFCISMIGQKIGGNQHSRSFGTLTKLLAFRLICPLIGNLRYQNIRCLNTFHREADLDVNGSRSVCLMGWELSECPKARVPKLAWCRGWRGCASQNVSDSGTRHVDSRSALPDLWTWLLVLCNAGPESERRHVRNAGGVRSDDACILCKEWHHPTDDATGTAVRKSGCQHAYHIDECNVRCSGRCNSGYRAASAQLVPE